MNNWEGLLAAFVFAAILVLTAWRLLQPPRRSDRSTGTIEDAIDRWDILSQEGMVPGKWLGNSPAPRSRRRRKRARRRL